MREREVFLEGMRKNNHNRVILKQYDLNMHSFANFDEQNGFLRKRGPIKHSLLKR